MVLCIEKMSNTLGDRGQTIFYALKKSFQKIGQLQILLIQVCGFESISIDHFGGRR